MELLKPPVMTTPLIPVVTKTGNYSATAADGVIFANGTITITLPSPSAEATGRQYTVKNIHATATVTVATSSGTIDGVTGVTSMSLAPKEAVTVVSNGTNWYPI